MDYQLVALADVTFQVPMHGFVESLNVSVAAGIALHTTANQRRLAYSSSVCLICSGGLALDIVDITLALPHPSCLQPTITHPLPLTTPCPQTDQTPLEQDQLRLEYILRSAFQLWSGEAADVTVRRLGIRLDELQARLLRHGHDFSG